MDTHDWENTPEWLRGVPMDPRKAELDPRDDEITGLQHLAQPLAQPTNEHRALRALWRDRPDLADRPLHTLTPSEWRNVIAQVQELLR